MKANLRIILIASALFIPGGLFLYFLLIHKKGEERPKVKVEITMNRLEQALTASSNPNLDALYQIYGEDLNIYTAEILGIGEVSDPNTAIGLQQYFSDPYIKQLHDDVAAKFGTKEMDKLEDDFNRGFGFVKSYFPSIETPKVVTMVSGFKIGNALTDSSMLLGLDLFLGADYPFYSKVDFIMQYQTKRLTPKHILPNSMYLMAEEILGQPPHAGNLLDNMLYYGKLYYLVEKFLPGTADSLIIGYSADQIEWCKNSEGSVWAYLIDQQMLYSTENVAIRKFINDGPFTSGLPNESPAMLGRWVGWQMVRSYMKANKRSITIPKLLDLQDSAEFLKKSKYKPKIE